MAATILFPSPKSGDRYCEWVSGTENLCRTLRCPHDSLSAGYHRFLLHCWHPLLILMASAAGCWITSLWKQHHLRSSRTQQRNRTTSIPSGSSQSRRWLYNGGPYQLVVFHFHRCLRLWDANGSGLSTRHAALDLCRLLRTCCSSCCCVPGVSVCQGSFSDGMHGISGTSTMLSSSRAQHPDASIPRGGWCLWWFSVLCCAGSLSPVRWWSN